VAALLKHRKGPFAVSWLRCIDK